MHVVACTRDDHIPNTAVTACAATTHARALHTNTLARMVGAKASRAESHVTSDVGREHLALHEALHLLWDVCAEVDLGMAKGEDTVFADPGIQTAMQKAKVAQNPRMVRIMCVIATGNDT